MIKAGSLYYAIIICVLVGISCMSFLLLSHYSKMHAVILNTHTELLDNNNSAVNFFLDRIDEIEIAPKKVDILENGIVTKGSVSNWGFFKILKVTSIFKNDSVEKYTLLGKKDDNNTALYLSDHDKPLYMVGKAKIYGDIYAPKEGIKKGYITTNAFSSFTFLEGNKYVSRKTLPKVEGVFKRKEGVNSDSILIENIKDQEIFYNSFKNKTVEIEVNVSSFKNKILAGNIIINAKDSLYIRKDNSLDGIIIKAPKVVFEKGFKGVVQVIAQEKVELEEKVVLKYPSGIYIDNDNAQKVEVILNEGSKILGAVVVTGSTSVGSTGRIVSIKEDAEIVGNVYCYGSTDLKGKITGTLFTDSFYLKTNASSYENYIENGVIDHKLFPEFFLGISFAENSNIQRSRYGVIKQL